VSNLVDKFIARYGKLPTEVDPDYLEMLRMSKYRILDVPDKQPGKCANCGASKCDGRKYVDFGLHVDWYGAVHLCTHCLTDIAKNAGLFKELENKLGILLDEQQNLASLKNQGVELHETVVKTYKEFEDYYAGLYSISDNSTPDPTPDVVIDETPPSESGTDQTEPESVKSTNGTRSKNLRSITDLLGDVERN
jgi:hypothetical protein